MRFERTDGLELTPLLEHPEALPTVSRWLQREWMHHYGRTLSDTRAEVRTRLNRHDLPMAWVARVGRAVVGTVSISADARAAQTHSLWCLAGLYVNARWRRRGIGGLMCAAAISKARELGMPTLGLYTQEREAYFARQGWQAQGIVSVELSGELQLVTRMVLSLDATALREDEPAEQGARVKCGKRAHASSM